MTITAFYLAEQILLKRFRESYSGKLLQENPSELFYGTGTEGYFYVFDYGAVAFANLADAEMSQTLVLLQQFCVNPLPEKLRDDFEVEESPGSPVEVQFERLIVPEINSGVVKIAMLNTAQTVAMDFFDARAQSLLAEVHGLTEEMELRGTIRISRRNMLRFIGRALNNKNRIVENLFIFNAPDLTWDDEYLDRIHRGLARNFELQSRFKEIEYTFRVIEDNLAVFREFYLHRESSVLEWIIIILICIEVIDLIAQRIF